MYLGIEVFLTFRLVCPGLGDLLYVSFVFEKDLGVSVVSCRLRVEFCSEAFGHLMGMRRPRSW